MGWGEGGLQQCTSREKDSFCLLKKTTTFRLSTVLTINLRDHSLFMPGGLAKKKRGKGGGASKNLGIKRGVTTKVGYRRGRYKFPLLE